MIYYRHILRFIFYFVDKNTSLPRYYRYDGPYVFQKLTNKIEFITENGFRGNSLHIFKENLSRIKLVYDIDII